MLDAGSAIGPDRISEGRLDSWKAIAAYLGRDVSTVRRWEKTEGLPVHRHRHAARGSAYAYKLELDHWFESRRAALELQRPDQARQAADDSPAEPDVPALGAPATTLAAPSRGRLRIAWIAGAAALAVAAIVLAVTTRTWPSASSPGFQQTIGFSSVILRTALAIRGWTTRFDTRSSAS
jgi:hypothetical protein